MCCHLGTPWWLHLGFRGLLDRGQFPLSHCWFLKHPDTGEYVYTFSLFRQFECPHCLTSCLEIWLHLKWKAVALSYHMSLSHFYHSSFYQSINSGSTYWLGGRCPDFCSQLSLMYPHTWIQPHTKIFTPTCASNHNTPVLISQSSGKH